MAGKGKRGGGRKGGYDNALGSIFDFIYKNKYKQGKLKPRKMTGVRSGSDAIAGGLGELAMNPALVASRDFTGFANNTLLDVEITKFQLDKVDSGKYQNIDGNAGRFRIKLSDFGRAIKNPRGFVDGIARKADEERKAAKWAAFGAGIDAAGAMYVGWRNGMKPVEAMNFGFAAHKEYTESMKEEHRQMIAKSAAYSAEYDAAWQDVAASGVAPVGSPAFLSAVQSNVISRKASADKKAEALSKAMRSSSKLIGTDFAGKGKDLLDPANQAQYLSVRGELENNLLRGGLAHAEVQSLLDRFDTELKGSTYGANISGYRLSYARQQTLEAQFLAPGSAERERNLTSANAALLWNRMKGDSEISGSNIGADLKRIRADITRLKSQGVLSANDQQYLADIQRIESRLSSTYTEAQGQRLGQQYDFWRDPNADNFAHRMSAKTAQKGLEAQMEYQLASLERKRAATTDPVERMRIAVEIESLGKTLNGISRIPGTDMRMALGNFVAYSGAIRGSMSASGLITGVPFFDNGAASPGEMGAFSGVQKWDSVNNRLMSKDDIKKNPVYGFGIMIVTPSDSVNLHFSKLTDLYYFTPTSALKTVLWDGNGFAYMAYKRQMQLQRAFGRDNGDILSNYLRTYCAGNPLFADFFEGGEVNKAALAQNYLTLMELLKQQGNLPADVAGAMGKAWELYGSASRFAGIADRLATPMRTAKLIEAKIKGWFPLLYDKDKKIINRILKGMFKNNSFWQDAVSQFAGGAIGFRQLIKVAVTSALNAIGIVSTAGVSAVVFVVTWVLSELGYKFGKVGLQLMIVAVVALCGILAFMPLFLESVVSPETVAYATMVPGEAVACGVGVVPGDDGTGGVDPIGGKPPAGSICPINKGAVCSQGPYGLYSHYKSGSNKNRYAIDVPGGGVWKAPTDGTVIDVGEALCNIDPDSGVSVGKIVQFKDSSGNTYRMLHVNALVTEGARVTKGTPIAAISTSIPVSRCWSGAHYHLEVKTSAGWVDAEKWYDDLGCNLQTCPR